MARILSWLLAHAVGLAVAAWLFDGISFAGPGGDLAAEAREKAVPLIVVALILGVVTAVVRPVLKVLSFPLILLTLGLFVLVINALMLLLTDWLADRVGVGFEVSGFWTAVGGALVITLVAWGVDALVGSDE